MDMEDPAETPTGPLDAVAMLLRYAEAEADISDMIREGDLGKLCAEVIENYDRDKQSRVDWETVSLRALKDMAQGDYPQKNTPWEGAANVHYPLLGYAVMQFNARAYPAIVKGDEAVSIKVIGADDGLPQTGPDGQPMMQLQGMPVGQTPQGMAVMTPQGLMPLPQGAQPEPVWKRAPGAKTKRAGRVSNYMNYQLFYRMDDWEGETDAMLSQVAAVGVAFRKVWFDGVKHNSRFVPALKLVVNNDATTLATAPQITEEIDGVYPIHIRRDIAVGKYRGIVLDETEREARTLIEQQCHYDMDGDGIPEPYIVTVDYKSKQILRVVPDFGPEDVKLVGGRLAYIERRQFYVKYEFLPHPEGKFYNIGLGHLLDQYGAVVNTIINQMIDANTAATAGGGFIASGLRIQGQGQSSALRFRPGEYKTIGVSGSALREGIVDRTFPNMSPVMFNLLELILGAAKEIASIKDVMTGDASNTGQVGTTLALIEQGLQVFTAIYKRVYRGMKSEFTLLFRNMADHGDEQMQADYIELLDDPAADFAADFNGADMDIRPVSDPSNVTKMQKMARAQFLLSTAEQLAAVGGDGREALRRAYEAADIEDIDKLLPPPDPMGQVAQQMQLAKGQADIKAVEARAARDMANAQATGQTVQLDEARLQRDSAVDAAKLEIEHSRTLIDAFDKGARIGAA